MTATMTKREDTTESSLLARWTAGKIDPSMNGHTTKESFLTFDGARSYLCDLMGADIADAQDECIVAELLALNTAIHNMIDGQTKGARSTIGAFQYFMRPADADEALGMALLHARHNIDQLSFMMSHALPRAVSWPLAHQIERLNAALIYEVNALRSTPFNR